MRTVRRKPGIIYAMLLSAMLLLPMLSGSAVSRPERPEQKRFGVEDMETFLDLHNRRNSSQWEPGGLTERPLSAQEEALYKEMFPVMITELRARYDKPERSAAKRSSIQAVLGGGEDCATAREITATPFNDSGDTTGHTSNVGASSCIEGNIRSSTEFAPDLIYSFTPTERCLVDIIIDPTDEGADADDLSLYVVRDGMCFIRSNECLTGSDFGGHGIAERLIFTANAGTRYFIVVDGGGIGSNEQGPYNLRMTCLTEEEVRRAFNPQTTIRPVGIENDGADNLWVVDNAFDEIQKIDLFGGFITGGPHGPNTVNAVGITTDGNFLYVTDTGDANPGNENVDIFTMQGIFTGSFGCN